MQITFSTTVLHPSLTCSFISISLFPEKLLLFVVRLNCHCILCYVCQTLNVYELEIDSTDLSVCLNCLSLRCPQKHDSQYILRRFHCTPINCEHAFQGGGRAKKGRRDISSFFAQNSFSSKPPTRYCAQELFSSAGCRRVILPSKLIPI